MGSWTDLALLAVLGELLFRVLQREDKVRNQLQLLLRRASGRLGRILARVEILKQAVDMVGHVPVRGLDEPSEADWRQHFRAHQQLRRGLQVPVELHRNPQNTFGRRPLGHPHVRQMRENLDQCLHPSVHRRLDLLDRAGLAGTVPRPGESVTLSLRHALDEHHELFQLLCAAAGTDVNSSKQ